MACSLTISSVLGIGPVAGVPTAIRVTGTATDCAQVNLTITCTGGTAFGGTAVVGSGGAWTVDVPTPPNSGCQCGLVDIFIQAVCVNDPTCTTSFGTNLACEGACPTAVWSGLTIGNCNPDGTRTVTISATVTAPNPCTAELRDGSPTPLATVSGSGTLTLSGSRNYTGTVTFSVVITSPAGCPGITLPITLADCFVCPTIAWDLPVISATCDTALKRLVTVTVHLSSPSSSSFSAALRNAGVTLATASGSGSLTLSSTGSYPGGSMQTFEVVITSHSDCGGSSITVKVDDCCPTITFTEQISPNCVNGNRSVTVKADLSLPTAYAAELHDPHGHMDTFSGSGMHTLQLTDNYPGGSSQTFSVVITSPAGCPGQSHTVNVSACNGGDGGGGFGCAALLISAITLLVIGAALGIIGVCFSVPPLTIAGGIAAGVGLLLFILWAVLCARFTPCSVMQTMHCILFFIIAVIAPIIALLAFLFGGLPCQAVVLGAWGGWGTIYAWLGVAMGSVGCPKTC